jgi:hypothetical protein
VLHGRRKIRGVPQAVGGAERPIRVAQQVARKKYEVRLAVAHNLISLGRLG